MRWIGSTLLSLALAAACARMSKPLYVPPVRCSDSQQSPCLEGRVVIAATVDTLGHVVPSSVRVLSSSDPRLEAAARDAVLRGVYRPARREGRLVPQAIAVPVSFRVVAPTAPGDLSGEPPCMRPGRPSSEFAARLTREYHPEVLEAGDARTLVGFVLDEACTVVRHTVSTLVPEDAASGTVLTRLFPGLDLATFVYSGITEVATGRASGAPSVVWVVVRRQ